jgi:hypothetical protein
MRWPSAAYHQPRQGPQKLPHPRARHPAHPRQPPRSDEPATRGDEGPELGEGDGAVDGPGVGIRAGDVGGGGCHGVCVVVRGRNV